jgi:hypothetical protein
MEQGPTSFGGKRSVESHKDSRSPAHSSSVKSARDSSYGQSPRKAGTPRRGGMINSKHDPAFHLGRRICYDSLGLCTLEKDLSMAILSEYFENFWLR